MHPRHAIAQARAEERRALLPPMVLDGPGRRVSILDLEPLDQSECTIGEVACFEDIAIGPHDLDDVVMLMPDFGPPLPDLGENPWDALRTAVVGALTTAGCAAVKDMTVAAAVLAATTANAISRRACAARALLRLRLHAAHLCTAARTLPAPITARAARAS